MDLTRENVLDGCYRIPSELSQGGYDGWSADQQTKLKYWNYHLYYFFPDRAMSEEERAEWKEDQSHCLSTGGLDTLDDASRYVWQWAKSEGIKITLKEVKKAFQTN